MLRCHSSKKYKTMFITDQDYKVVIGEQALKVISQVSENNRINAEHEAIEEISSYLRPKFDTNAVFSTIDRNSLIVMYACDIALYHMAASTPQKMGMEIRKERYERAIKWLEGVQSGKIVPNLPHATDKDGEFIGGTIVCGSQKPLKHNW